MDSVEYDKLDDPRKWTKKLGSETGLPTGEMEWPIELVCPSKEDVEAFFETVLSVEKLCENIRIGTQLEKRVASGEDVEEVNDSDPRDFRLLWFFRVCWVRTYTDYPIILVDELSGRLSSLTINPHVAYLSGQYGIERAYEEMEAERQKYALSIADSSKKKAAKSKKKVN